MDIGETKKIITVEPIHESPSVPEPEYAPVETPVEEPVPA